MDQVPSLAPTDPILSMQPPPPREDPNPPAETNPSPPVDEKSGSSVDTYA